jgi:hypothetical protein
MGARAGRLKNRLGPKNCERLQFAANVACFDVVFETDLESARRGAHQDIKGCEAPPLNTILIVPLQITGFSVQWFTKDPWFAK